MLGWKSGGYDGIAHCELCGARNVTYRFRIKNVRTRASLLICRICRDSFYPKHGCLSILQETPDIMDHWANNQKTGQWPSQVDI